MTKRNVVLTREVGIDEEIADEIVWLNKQGVRTVESCSDHGEHKPVAWIHGNDYEQAVKLGYKPIEPTKAYMIVYRIELGHLRKG